MMHHLDRAYVSFYFTLIGLFLLAAMFSGCSSDPVRRCTAEAREYLSKNELAPSEFDQYIDQCVYLKNLHERGVR